MEAERVAALEAQVRRLQLATGDLAATLSFVDDRLVAAELVVGALVSRLRTTPGEIANIRRQVAAATENESEEGRRVAEHASHLLADG